MRLRHLLLTCLAGGALAFAGCAEDGKDGADGAQGPAGPAGADGTDGTNGQNGAEGAQGPAGTNGTNGTDAPCAAYELIAFDDVTGLPDPVLTDSDVTFQVNFTGAEGGAIGPNVDVRFLQTPVETTATANAGEFTANFSDADAGPQTFLGAATDGCSVTFFDFTVTPELWRAYVSVVHVSPSAGNVKVVPAGTTTAFNATYEDLAPGTAGQLIATNQNLTEITVSILNPDDDTVIATLDPITLVRDQHITVVALEDAAGTTMFTAVETGAADFDSTFNTQVNLFHAAAGVGTIDGFDLGDLDDPSDDVVIYDDVAFNTLSAETVSYEAATGFNDDGDIVFAADPFEFGLDGDADVVIDRFYTITAGLDGGDFFPGEYGTSFVWVNGDGKITVLHRAWSTDFGVFAGNVPTFPPPPVATCDAGTCTYNEPAVETAIPDDDDDGLRFPFLITDECEAVLGIEITANVTHTFPGDIDFFVTAPETAEISFGGGSGSGDITMEDIVSGGADETGTLPLNTYGTGEWVVRVADTGFGDDGTLHALQVIVTCGAPVAPPTAEVEPNDTAAQGQTIAVGETVMGSIATNADVDWYKVTVTVGTDVTFAAGPNGGTNVDLEMWLCDNTDLANCDDTGGNLARVDNTGSSGTEQITETLAPGDYWVGVAHWSRGGSGDYNLVVTGE